MCVYPQDACAVLGLRGEERDGYGALDGPDQISAPSRALSECHKAETRRSAAEVPGEPLPALSLHSDTLLVSVTGLNPL